jgi:hypothetical protein
MLGIAAQGNAYGQALTGAKAPNMKQSPSFGGGVYSGAANTGTPGSGVSAGMSGTAGTNVAVSPNGVGGYSPNAPQGVTPGMGGAAH